MKVAATWYFTLAPRHPTTASRSKSSWCVCHNCRNPDAQATGMPPNRALKPTAKTRLARKLLRASASLQRDATRVARSGERCCSFVLILQRLRAYCISSLKIYASVACSCVKLRNFIRHRWAIADGRKETRTAQGSHRYRGRLAVPRVLTE